MKKKQRKVVFIVLLILVNIFIPKSIYAKEIINEIIELEGMKQPIEDELPSKITKTDERYNIEQKWFKDDTKEEMSQNETFEFGKSYLYNITINPKEDYVFSNEASIVVKTSGWTKNWSNSILKLTEDGKLSFVAKYTITQKYKENKIVNGAVKYNVKNGWVIDAEKKYYYQNGEMVKGFKEIDGKLYFFSTATGTTKTGWQTLDGINKFYCNNDGTVKNNGLEKIEGKLYYFNKDGFIHKGFKEVDGKLYFFSTATGTTKTGWQTLDGINKFYCNSDGTVKNNGLEKIEGKLYYFNKDGYIYKGFKEVDGKLYFFSTATGTTKTGLQTLDGIVKFYCNDDGTLYKGFKEIDGKIYFFSTTTGLTKRGLQTLDGIVKFYCNDDGTLYKGFKEIEGKLYFFSTATGLTKTGLQTLDGIAKFFCNNDGTVYKGFKEIDGKLYFFSTANGLSKVGWQALELWKYFYCNSDGTVVIGTANIENRDYNFGSDGYLLGFKNENGNIYYDNPDGTPAKGLQRIAGNYFMFDSVTGKFLYFVNRHTVIDVSHHQGIINWDMVKASGMVDAVIVRMGYASDGIDQQAIRNIQELNRVGIPYTIYLYSYAENGAEAIGEANYLINWVRSNPVYIDNRFSIYYDIEEFGTNISQENYRNIINNFINSVQGQLGIRTRVYTSKNNIKSWFPSDVWQYVTWIAQWGPACTYDGAYEGWQYTSSGSVPGIDGRVDMSIFYY